MEVVADKGKGKGKLWKMVAEEGQGELWGREVAEQVQAEYL